MHCFLECVLYFGGIHALYWFIIVNVTCFLTASASTTPSTEIIIMMAIKNHNAGKSIQSRLGWYWWGKELDGVPTSLFLFCIHYRFVWALKGSPNLYCAIQYMGTEGNINTELLHQCTIGQSPLGLVSYRLYDRMDFGLENMATTLLKSSVNPWAAGVCKLVYFA